MLKIKLMTELYLASIDALKKVERENEGLRRLLKIKEYELKLSSKNCKRASIHEQQLRMEVHTQDLFLEEVITDSGNYRRESVFHRAKWIEAEGKLRQAKREIERLKESQKVARSSRLLNTAFCEHNSISSSDETLEITTSDENSMILTGFCDQIER